MMRIYLSIFLIVSFLAGCSDRESSNTTISKEQEPTAIVLEKSEGWGNAPDFTTVRVGDGEFKLSSLKGKVILLNFWAVECSACKMQIPVFVRLYKEYKAQGLEIVGIASDRESVVKSYAESMNMDYILVSLNREIARKYREVRGIPMTFVIDRQGNIVEKYIGYTSKNTIEEKIKEILQKTEDK
jgi:peroxiredoxin